MKQKIVYTTNTTGLLLVAFVVLKLTNVITWSWWWVVSPLWIPFVLALFVLFSISIFTYLIMLYDNKDNKWLFR